MVHETSKELLAMHALSALDAADQQELQSHLETCTACRRELEDWQATAAALAYLAAPLEPSVNLREQILETVRSERSDAPLREPTNLVTFSRAGGLRRSRWPALAAIAAALVFIALASALIVLWRQNHAARVELARISRELNVQEQKFARENKIVQLLTTPGIHSTELRGTKDAPNAHAMIAVDPHSGRAMLMARGLPPAPAGKAYQLWFIFPGQAPAPGKLFTTDPLGEGLLEDQLPRNSADSFVFAVTLEPQAGVPAPTGTMYLLSPRAGS
jgi:anti-sigma-K factor RskA